jgi:hypothetical protein
LIAVTTGLTGTITIGSANCRNFGQFLVVATVFGDKHPAEKFFFFAQPRLGLRSRLIIALGHWKHAPVTLLCSRTITSLLLQFFFPGTCVVFVFFLFDFVAVHCEVHQHFLHHTLSCIFVGLHMFVAQVLEFLSCNIFVGIARLFTVLFDFGATLMLQAKGSSPIVAWHHNSFVAVDHTDDMAQFLVFW